MKFVTLKFKKIGNHWYLDIPHDNPEDLKLESNIERFINRLDIYNEGIVEKIALIEQNEFVYPENLIQFSDSDLLRYFTTSDKFIMTFYIKKHQIHITSGLYTLLEKYYDFQFHLLTYKISIL